MKNKIKTIEDFCPNFADLSEKEKIFIEEQIYKKQMYSTGYSVTGVDYKPKYDTGEERNGSIDYTPKTKRRSKKVN